MLMEGIGVSAELPYIVKQTAFIWQTFVERVLEHALFHPELSIWQLAPVQRMVEKMSFQAWREGGCMVLVDLYTNDTFITFEQACEGFDLGQGKYLQYAGQVELVRITWPTHPNMPQTTETLDILLTCGSGRRPVSLL